MSKFLEIVEGNTPETDIDTITDAKRTLQRMLINLGVKVDAKIFEDVLIIKLPDGRSVKLEIKNVTKPTEEEAEDPGTAVSAIEAIASLRDDKKNTSPAKRKLMAAQNVIADTGLKLADKFKKSVGI